MKNGTVVTAEVGDYCGEFDDGTFQVCCVDEDGNPGCNYCDECAPYQEVAPSCCTSSKASEGNCNSLTKTSCCWLGETDQSPVPGQEQGFPYPFGFEWECMLVEGCPTSAEDVARAAYRTDPSV